MTKFPGNRFKCRKKILEQQLNRAKIPRPRVGLIGVGGGGSRIVASLAQTEGILHQRFKHFIRLDFGMKELPEDYIGIEVEAKESLDDQTKQRLENFAWNHDLIILCSTLGGETSRNLLPKVIEVVKANEWAKVLAFLIFPSRHENEEVLSHAIGTKNQLMGEADLLFLLDNDLLEFSYDSEIESDPWRAKNLEIVDSLNSLILHSSEKVSLWNHGKSIEKLKGCFRIHYFYVPINSDANLFGQRVNKMINDKIVFMLKKLSENGMIGGIVLLLEVPVSFSILKTARLISDLKHKFDKDGLIRLAIFRFEEWNSGGRCHMLFLEEI